MAEPIGRVWVGDWAMDFAYPVVEATRGGWTFQGDAGHGNHFTDASWRGEFPEEQAIADFQAAYAELDIGPPPTDAGVGGSIC